MGLSKGEIYMDRYERRSAWSLSRVFWACMAVVLLLGSMLLAASFMWPGLLSRMKEWMGGGFQQPQTWNLTLVNSRHAVPDGYEVPLLTLSNGVRVDERIYPSLQQMFDDARAEGLEPEVTEGYRSREDQEAMMQRYIDSYLEEDYSNRKAKALAEDFVAKPGTSEHELGLAVDINAAEGEDGQAVYDWLAAHAWEYGFILRYPEGREKITGIVYEPWHYRYVGAAAAAEIQNTGMMLEEYLGV